MFLLSSITSYKQARRQNIAAGGSKNQKEGRKTRRGAHFKNTVLDVCSNQGAKREMEGTDFKWGTGHHCPPASDGPAYKEFDQTSTTTQHSISQLRSEAIKFDTK